MTKRIATRSLLTIGAALLAVAAPRGALGDVCTPSPPPTCSSGATPVVIGNCGAADTAYATNMTHSFIDMGSMMKVQTPGEIVEWCAYIGVSVRVWPKTIFLQIWRSVPPGQWSCVRRDGPIQVFPTTLGAVCISTASPISVLPGDQLGAEIEPGLPVFVTGSSVVPIASAVLCPGTQIANTTATALQLQVWAFLCEPDGGMPDSGATGDGGPIVGDGGKVPDGGLLDSGLRRDAGTNSGDGGKVDSGTSERSDSGEMSDANTESDANDESDASSMIDASATVDANTPDDGAGPTGANLGCGCSGPAGGTLAALLGVIAVGRGRQRKRR
jgi:hypothetical protein